MCIYNYFGNKKILIIGASSDLAKELNESLYQSGAKLGLHYNSNIGPLNKFDDDRVLKIQKDLSIQKNCHSVVDEFHDWADGIDCLVQLSGGISHANYPDELTEQDVWYDLNINLIAPFFLAQRAIYYFKKNKTSGKIVMMSNAGASHGGGSKTLIYGVAKAGIERLVRGLAKDCAGSNILVNAVAPGFITSKIHTEKMNRSEQDIVDRVKMIPLKRAGTSREVSETIMFLLSESATYITGETITVSGGDWL
ncbi:MAG: SDR family oxidoreductase [Oligoflexia bacterium]|nr:SDR family oxidoreductase [Oligoflexia bacterium]